LKGSNNIIWGDAGKMEVKLEWSIINNEKNIKIICNGVFSSSILNSMLVLKWKSMSGVM